MIEDILYSWFGVSESAAHHDMIIPTCFASKQALVRGMGLDRQHVLNGLSSIHSGPVEYIFKIEEKDEPNIIETI